MIVNVEQIDEPESGRYRELIYDIESSFNSEKWIWLKFTDEDYEEWCGEFRGQVKGYGISKRDNCIYVLTGDYLYLLDSRDGKLLKYEETPEYQGLTVSPQGDCIVATYNHIEVIDSNLESQYNIETPIPLDMIIFSEWKGNELLIHADEFCNWDNHVVLNLNCETCQTEIVSQTSKGVNCD